MTCQCLVTAFQTPTLPVLLVAISWFPTKKSASAGTFRLKTPEERGRFRGNLLTAVSNVPINHLFLPISFPLPSGQMAQRMISVTEATATILSLSPSEPAITLALSATLSISQSRRGEVKTCCHPVDSFTLKHCFVTVVLHSSEIPLI